MINQSYNTQNNTYLLCNLCWFIYTTAQALEIHKFSWLNSHIRYSQERILPKFENKRSQCLYDARISSQTQQFSHFTAEGGLFSFLAALFWGKIGMEV